MQMNFKQFIDTINTLLNTIDFNLNEYLIMSLKRKTQNQMN